MGIIFGSVGLFLRSSLTHHPDPPVQAPTTIIGVLHIQSDLKCVFK